MNVEMKQSGKSHKSIALTPELEAELIEFVHQRRVTEAEQGVPRGQRSTQTSVIERAIAEHVADNTMSDSLRARLSRYVSDNGLVMVDAISDAVDVWLTQRGY